MLCAVSLLTIVRCSASDDVSSDDTPTTELIDTNATAATKSLYAALRSSASQGVILGQQEAYLENTEKEYQSNCDIYDITGAYPLLSGCDLENLTNDEYPEGDWWYTRVENMREWIKECHRKGVFVTLSWHFREPYNGDAFYTSKMDETTKANAFKSILEGGENHLYYKRKLVLLADFFKSLTDDDGELIPIIFRPFHEFGGSWFWWGVPYYATSQEYIQNWQFTVDFLRTGCAVHNLIYAFTPGFESESDYLESYPGDNYVDIFGFDSYTSDKIGDAEERASELDEMVSQLNIISSLATRRGKVAALTEFGHNIIDESKTFANPYTEYYLEVLKRMDANIAYMMFWLNSDKQFTPESENTEYIEDFKSFVGNEQVLILTPTE